MSAVSDSAFALGRGRAVVEENRVTVYNMSRPDLPLTEGDNFGIRLPVTYSAADRGLNEVTMEVTLREEGGQSTQVMSFSVPFLRKGNRPVFNFRPFNTEQPNGAYIRACNAINFDVVLTYTNSAGAQSDAYTFSFPIVTPDDSVPAGMALVPAGDFFPGQAPGVADALVFVSDFFIDITEVTASKYKECVDAGACTYTGSTTFPVRTYDVASHSRCLGDFEGIAKGWIDEKLLVTEAFKKSNKV